MRLLLLFLPLAAAFDLSLDLEEEENLPTMEEIPENNNENLPTTEEIPESNNENLPTVQEVPESNNENLPTVQEVPESNNENLPTVQEVPEGNNENLPTAQEVPENENLPKKDVVPENAKKEIIELHNEFRRNVEPPASNMLKMTWNNEIAETSKAWVEKCTGKRSDKNDRILNGVPCAEIISKSTGATSWKEIIEMWYSKKSNFQYGIGAVDTSKDASVYTQLIWYKSHEVGCAVAYCPGNDYPFIYACRYCPAGNIVGQLLTPYRKGEPCGDCPNDCEDKLCTNPCKYHDKVYGCKDLINTFDCNAPPLKDNCQATCNCQTEIV